MTANPLTNVHLRGRDRLAYQLRALRRLYPHVLSGRHDLAIRGLFSDDGLKVSSAGELHTAVSRTDDDDAVRLGGPGASAAHFRGAGLDPLAAPRLHEFHRHGLSKILGISEGFAEGQAPHYSQRYLDWSWNEMSNWDASPPNLSATSREGVLAAHELILCQLATDLAGHIAKGKKPGKRSLPEARALLLERLRDRVRSLAEKRADTGEMLSHWLALEGVKLVITASRGQPGRPLGPLPEYWQCLAPDLHPIVAHLLGKNELVLQLQDLTRQHVHSVRPVPTREPITIVPHVQGVLSRLSQFGSRLVIEEKPQDIKKPVFIGDVAHSEVEKFAALDSPTLSGAESDTLRKSLHSELREAEQKLFRTTVTPRPAFYDAFINWASRHVVLTSGVHLPLSEQCLDLVLLCHNVLALDQALADEEQADKPQRSAAQQAVRKIRESIEGPAKVIAQLDPGIGDMLVLLRAVEGLRVSLAQRHAGSAKAPWGQVLKRIPQEVAGHVLALAGKSPLVRLTVPALEEALGDEAPWTSLERLLDDPRAEPLRDFAAGELVAHVVADRELMGTFGRRALGQCLATGTLGGALLVAEFFQVLFQKLFVPCDIAAAAFRDPHEEATAKKLKAAAVEFGQWFFDIDQEGPRAVFESLVGLLDLVLEFEDSSAEADAPRVALLRHQWRSITRIATRGLVRRPWRHEAQRLLRMFWLNFCLLAYRRFDVLPEALDTGLKQVDDLTSFSCWLAGQTYRTLRTYEHRQDRLKQTQLEQGWGDEALNVAATRESYVKNEFAIIKKRLYKDIVENSPKFRAGLVVRRILVRRSDKQLKWNEERIDELAALTK